MKSLPAVNPLESHKAMEIAVRHGSTAHAPELKTFFFILLERAWVVVLCLLLAGVATFYYLKHAPRIYSSMTTVQVEQGEKKVVKIENVVNEDMRSLEILNTIAQRLKAPVLLEQVIMTNNLSQDPTFFADGKTDVPMLQMVGYLDGLIDTRLRRSTRLIDIIVSHTDPNMAARIADSLVHEYINQESQMYFSTTLDAYNFLKEESERLKKKLENSEVALQDYRKKVGSVSLQQSQDIVVPQLRDLSQRVTAARADRLRAEQLYDQLMAAGGKLETLLDIPSVAMDPQVVELRSALTKAEVDFSNLEKHYKEKHPKFMQAQASLMSLRNRFTNAVLAVPRMAFSTLASAKVVEEKLAKALDQAENEALLLSEQAIQFNVLSREVDSDRALFDSTINRMKETSLTQNIQPDMVRVIQPARVPELPSSPKVMMVAVAGVFGGIVAGVLLALLMHTMDSSLHTVDEVEEYLHVPVLGTVPFMMEFSKGKSKTLIMPEESNSSAAEAFRTLRTSLGMLGREEANRVFLFTSAFPQEGKTFCSINTAATLAQQGLRTLLIDADLRRPSLEQRIFGREEKRAGVTDILLGQRRISEVVQDMPMPQLKVVLAGSRVPNPAELLAQGGFTTLIEEALREYDRVVIDSAPIHAVSDTLVILKRVDNVIIVVRSGKTPRRAVSRAIQLIQQAGASVGGAVVNWLPLLRSRGYYYGSYYYGSYYYGHGDYYHSDDGTKKRKGKPASGTENKPQPGGPA